MATYHWKVTAARLLPDGVTIRATLSVATSDNPAAIVPVDVDVLASDPVATKLTKARTAVQAATMIGYSEDITF